MTTERFDIEVRDAVAKSIRTELTAIGGAARSTHALVRELNRELASGTRSAAMSAQTAAAQANSAAGSSAAAQARATAESARAAAQAARTEAAIRKANVAYLQEEAALNRAVAAEARATRAKERLTSTAKQASAASETEAQQQERLAAVVERTAQRQQAAAASNAAAAARTQAAAGVVAPILAPAAATRAAVSVGAQTAVSTTARSATVEAAALTAAQARVAAGYRALSHDVTGNTLVMRESLVVGRELLSGNFTRLPGSLSIIGQQYAISGKSAAGFASTVLSSLGIIKKSSDVALDAAAAQAKAVADLIAGQLTAAESAAAAAGAEIELAEAQKAAATTATERTAASARLTAATEAQAAADAEAVVAAEALASANGAVAETSAAASDATVTSLGAVGKIAAPLAIALGVFALGLGAITHEANNDSGLKKYAKSMGYTASEVKKLNAVTVSFGDTARAVFQVGMRDILAAFGISTADMGKTWKRLLDWMASATRATLAGIYAGIMGTMDLTGNITRDALKGNLGIETITKSYRDRYAQAQQFFTDVGKQAAANARKRQDDMAALMVGNPKKGPKPWDRAQNLKNDNAELDAQIKLLALYGDELDRANQLEQISKKYRDHNVPLTTAETAGFEAKIKAMQDGRRVQDAMTAADELANGAARKYDATIDALTKMLEQGRLTQEQFNEQMFLAERAFEDAINPLAALNRELQKNGELMGLYGRDRDVASYIQQLREAAEARGQSIYKPGAQTESGEIVVTGHSRKLTDEAQGMVDQFRRQQQQGLYAQTFDTIDPRQRENPGDNSYILDHHKELYAEIKRLRDADVIDEEEANRRKKNLDRAYSAARLEGVSSMFEQLSQLQNSKNREVAALGKAAAIAQATIDGYRAVQAALAGPPGPPWSFAIAGVTAAITVANVARIAGVGFQRGGYTGDGSPNDVAGPAHRGEFVFDAAATRRIGVPALEASRRGLAPQAPANDDHKGGTNVYIRPMPGVFVEERRTSDGEIELIAARVVARDAPKVVAGDIRRGSNTHTGAAMKDAFGLQRTDR